MLSSSLSRVFAHRRSERLPGIVSVPSDHSHSSETSSEESEAKSCAKIRDGFLGILKEIEENFPKSPTFLPEMSASTAIFAGGKKIPLPVFMRVYSSARSPSERLLWSIATSSPNSRRNFPTI